MLKYTRLSKIFQHTLYVIFILVFIGGCSTDKNTRVSRAYHNVTAHYNVYFNGVQSLKSGVEKIDKSVDDDFTKLLLVYKSNDPGTGNVAKSDMENAILKASKLIKIHSITKKPKRRRNRSKAYLKLASKDEFNNWVDDSYILMGKAYFYMKNYNAAIENFSYVVRKFSEEDTKYEAYIWLIRSYTQMERYNEGLELIQSVDASEDFPSRFDEEFALAVADFYIHQNEYNNAIPQLKVAIKKSHRKKDKVRYKYILAQLYEETGQSELATETFNDVAKMNPPYQMAFNARINAAGAFSGKGDVSKLKKQLRKMLRDTKNFEYRDQIYFALGNIFKAEGNKQVAVDNYIKSAAASSQNVYQRALSCLTLANIYFDEKNYKGAQSYYDSAMVVIDDTYPNYQAISDRYNSLTRLTDNLYTVEREDSLQRIAALSEKERNDLISKWIQDAREEELRQQRLASAQMQDRSFYRMNQYGLGLNRRQSGSGWYFYNPTTVSYGKVEFEKLWGKRKLEDNWRRSDKHSASEVDMADQDTLTTASVDSAAINRVKDPKDREYYMQDLPLTEEKLEASNIRIRDALFNAGRIFKQDFDNYQRAINEYEDLLERYKDNIYQLTCYFELWDLYKKIGNQEKSDYYKNLIINNYPDSNYAKYLINPNFFIELEARKDSMNNLYQQAFYDYQQGNYQDAGQLAQQIKGLNPDSTLLAKVDFIGTIADGTSKGDWNLFEKDLNRYIGSFPKSSTIPLAKEVLKLIQDSTLADYQKLVEIGYLNDKIQNKELLPQNQASNDEFGGKFSYDEDLLHYFVIAFLRSANVDLNRLKFDIANYNIDHYTKEDFDLETQNLNNETELLVVRALSDKEQSLIYFRSIIRQRQVFETLKGVDYVNFVASSTNYREILSDKSYQEYLKFFIKNYSRFINSDFPTDELPSPEELMAKAKENEDKFVEKGTFVVVKADKTQGLYARENDVPQDFIIAVDDPSFNMRTLIAPFAGFNQSKFSSFNLKIEQQKFGDYQLMVVKSLGNIRDAMNYFSMVVANRKLYQSLETRSYRNFIISENNLEKMKSEGSIENYMDFFRSYYISGDFAKNAKQQTSPESQPVQQPEKQVVPAKPSYQGPFSTDVDGDQFFILIIPKQGINSQAVIASIQSHNENNFPNLGLTVSESAFDADNIILKVSGITDKQSGLNYLRSLVRDQQVYEPLMEVNYRNFVISPANYAILLDNKDTKSYLDFYKTYYLNK